MPGLPGREGPVKQFLLEYVAKHADSWAVQPTIISDDALVQDSLILVFGEPKMALFAHMDTVGYIVGYDNYVTEAGGPDFKPDVKLWGKLGQETITTKIVDEEMMCLDYPKPLPRGMGLHYVQNWVEEEDYVQSCYLDNRLGVFMALQLAATMQNGALVFSCWEEHGGGSVAYLANYLAQKYGTRQAVISDITWATEGIIQGQGAAITIRDRNLCRWSFVDKVIGLAEREQIAHQLEVVSNGSSDGRELQAAAWPWDWVFVGPPITGAHTPTERVHKADVAAAISLYAALMDQF